MGSGRSGLYSGVYTPQSSVVVSSQSKAKPQRPLFRKGRVTLQSISKHRETFMGKSAEELDRMLRQQGYETSIRPSKHASSKAKIIVVSNSDKQKNITQVQVSPGSPRHGGVPYVKISTHNLGKIKIIDAKKSDYKSDGQETAKLFFRRKRK